MLIFFSPSIAPSLRKTPPVLADLAPSRVVYLDFEGMGGRNGAQSALDLFNNKNASLSEVAAALRSGEGKATKVFTNSIDHAKSVALQIDAKAQVFRSGDDMTLVFAKPLTDDQQIDLLNKLSQTPQGVIHPSQWRTSFPANNSRSSIVLPESIQKKLKLDITTKPMTVRSLSNTSSATGVVSFKPTDFNIAVRVEESGGVKKVNLFVKGLRSLSADQVTKLQPQLRARLDKVLEQMRAQVAEYSNMQAGQVLYLGK
jgi:hypothetical protein